MAGGNLSFVNESGALLPIRGDTEAECFSEFPEALTAAVLLTPFAGGCSAAELAVVSGVSVPDGVARSSTVAVVMLVPLTKGGERAVTGAVAPRAADEVVAVAVATVGFTGVRLVSSTVLGFFGAPGVTDDSGADPALLFGGISDAAASLTVVPRAFFAVPGFFNAPFLGRCGCGR